MQRLRASRRCARGDWRRSAAGVPTRIRGTVDKLDGQNLMVKSRDGQTLTIEPAANVAVITLVKKSVADIWSATTGKHSVNDLRPSHGGGGLTRCSQYRVWVVACAAPAVRGWPSTPGSEAIA